MIRIIKANTPEFDDYISKPHNAGPNTAPGASLTRTVSEIIENIRARGDSALREYTAKFDNCELSRFELGRADIDKAIKNVDPKFIEIMERAAENIRQYHSNQMVEGFDLLPKDGVILGQKVTPLARVGCYVPGGSAPLPSSVLMNCIPAKLAGVGEIILVTPPSSGARGERAGSSDASVNGVDARILAAAKIAGADRVFTLGGAQAVAALAFGTESVPRVDKITGPGNAYVTEAKRQVFGAVGIDMLAGPSDVLVIADKKTKPEVAAADMLSQCEHGADSSAVLITDSMTLAKKVKEAIKAQLQTLPRADLATAAIRDNSVIIVAASIDEAFDISNKLAPEHLIVLVDEPFKCLGSIINAGSIFLGRHTPETLGDYLAGPNHILPTGGTARFSSPVTVGDFVKKTSYAYFSKEALNAKAEDAICFAKEESLDAHARAVEVRITN